MSALPGLAKEVPSKKCKHCNTIFYRKEDQRPVEWHLQLFCNKECHTDWKRTDPEYLKKQKENYNKPENIIKRKINGKEQRKKLKKLFKEKPEEHEKAKEIARNYKRKRYAENTEFRKKQLKAASDNQLKKSHSDPEFRKKQWEYGLKKRFGMTADEYYKISESQNEVCAICKDPKCNSKRAIRLAVDHDHKTGNVRELLGTRCNMVLGKVKDDPELLQKMILYLRKHKMLGLKIDK